MLKKIIFFIFLSLIFIKAEVIFEATGYGTTVLKAKDSALGELSGIIISNIDSKYTEMTKTSNSKNEGSSNYTLAVTSKTILKGIEYKSLGKKDGSFVYKATMTREALIDTMAYLKSEINVNANRLSRNEIYKKLEYISFLKPLLSYSQYRNDALNFVNIKETEFLNHLNQAQIEFHVVPKDAKIEINNRTFSSFQSLFLPKGKYEFTVSKKGYFSENGYLKVTKGEKIIKHINLIKDLQANNSIYLDITNKAYKNYADEVLNTYGIKTVNNTNNKFKLKIRLSKNFISEVYGMKFYTLKVVAQLFKNGKLYETKTATLRNKQSQYINSKSRLIVKKLIEVLFKKDKLQKYFN
jgi:hypothetical protein